VEVDGDRAGGPRYVSRPFGREPEAVTVSVNFDLEALLGK